MSRKKKSGAGRLLASLARAATWAALLAGAGFLSYWATLAYYDWKGGPGGGSGDERAAALIREYLGDGTELGEVSKNLILGVGEEGEIRHVLLEILNARTGNLDYVTIPADARFTISDGLYQELCAAGCDAPQILRMGDAGSYFSEETLYGCMVILAEDMLGTDIDYYTAVPEEEFSHAFSGEERRVATEGESPIVSEYEVLTVSEDFRSRMGILSDEESLRKYLKKLSDGFTSSLSLRDRYGLVDDYLRIDPDCIYSYGIFGERKEDCLEVAVPESAALVASIADNTYPHEEPQEAEGQEIGSEGYSIEILNGSGIDGLAAYYEGVLTENGYTVTHIGNYTLGTLAESKIVVREEGMGQDLLALVGEGEVEVGDLPDGVDIQVLLGTKAER